MYPMLDLTVGVDSRVCRRPRSRCRPTCSSVARSETRSVHIGSRLGPPHRASTRSTSGLDSVLHIGPRLGPHRAHDSVHIGPTTSRATSGLQYRATSGLRHRATSGHIGPHRAMWSSKKSDTKDVIARPRRLPLGPGQESQHYFFKDTVR